MRLIVLCGGFGTRLRSSIGEVQKSLAPVGENLFLGIQLDHWKKQGIKKFTFLLHYKYQDVIDYIEKKRRFGDLEHCEIDYITEERPLGTGGAIKNAISSYPSEPEFLICNSDTWLKDGIKKMMNVKPNTIGVVSTEDTSRFGQILCNNRGMVVSFEEKGVNHLPGLINAGIYKLKHDFFLNYDKKIFSIEKLFEQKTNFKEFIYAEILHTEFIDIGIPADYEKFLSSYKGKKNVQK